MSKQVAVVVCVGLGIPIALGGGTTFAIGLAANFGAMVAVGASILGIGGFLIGAGVLLNEQAKERYASD